MFTRGFGWFLRTGCTLLARLILRPRFVPWTRRTLCMRIAFSPRRILMGRILADGVLAGGILAGGVLARSVLAESIVPGRVVRRTTNIVARRRIVTLGAVWSRGIVSRSWD